MTATTFTREPFEVRVARGAAYLDRHSPNWHNGHQGDDIIEARSIDLDSLDLASGQACVLGQMFNGYGRGLDVFHLTPERSGPSTYDDLSGVVGYKQAEADLDDALERYTAKYNSDGPQIALAFLLPAEDYEVQEEEDPSWAALTQLWKGAVLARRAEDKLKVNTYQVIATVEAHDEQEAIRVALADRELSKFTPQLLHKGPRT